MDSRGNYRRTSILKCWNIWTGLNLLIGRVMARSARSGKSICKGRRRSSKASLVELLADGARQTRRSRDNWTGPERSKLRAVLLVQLSMLTQIRSQLKMFLTALQSASKYCSSSFISLDVLGSPASYAFQPITIALRPESRSPGHSVAYV